MMHRRPQKQKPPEGGFRSGFYVPFIREIIGLRQ
jgi:hypothetical protein